MHLHIISWYALLLEEQYFHQEVETVYLTIIHINYALKRFYTPQNPKFSKFLLYLLSHLSV